MKMNTKVKGALLIFFFLSGLCLLGQSFGPDQAGLQPNLDAFNLNPLTEGHILGTDSLGHDLFTIACLGARNSLAIGLISALIAVGFGTLWGAAASLAGSGVSTLMMRIVDALLAIPSLILLLALTALIKTPEFTQRLPVEMLELLGVTRSSLGLIPLLSIIVVISATSWLEAARIAYTKISALALEEYIEAAVSLGAGRIWLLLRHLLPNARRIILIQVILLVSDAVVMEAGLSFLGLGPGPATPSWGGMLRQAQSDFFYANWWAPLIPSLLISLTILSINLFGEGMLEERS